MGCKTHKITRKQAKHDYCVHWLILHCWCGHPLKRTQGNWSTPLNEQQFEIDPKKECSLNAHYKEYNHCGSTSRWISSKDIRSSPCGLHGLHYPHCKLCLEPTDGELIGTVNGIKKYRPFSIADRILRLLKLKFMPP